MIPSRKASSTRTKSDRIAKNTPIRFVDTSAYLTWVLDQPQASEIEKKLLRASLVASSILFIEAERAFLHLARTRVITERQGVALRERLVLHAKHFTVREPSLELCLSNVFPGMTTPKSSDLIHLRTALWFRERDSLDLFVTTDKQQELAARELGLPV